MSNDRYRIRHPLPNRDAETLLPARDVPLLVADHCDAEDIALGIMKDNLLIRQRNAKYGIALFLAASLVVGNMIEDRTLLAIINVGAGVAVLLTIFTVIGAIRLFRRIDTTKAKLKAFGARARLAADKEASDSQVESVVTEACELGFVEKG